MTTYPDPGTTVRVAARLGNSKALHLVPGHMVEYDDEKITIRPAGSYTTVWFDTDTVESVNAIPLSDLENEITVERLDHPLPETIRAHLVHHHGYTIHSVTASSTESLLAHHDETLHRQGQHLSHIHGLTARERDLVDKITRKDLP